MLEQRKLFAFLFVLISCFSILSVVHFPATPSPDGTGWVNGQVMPTEPLPQDGSLSFLGQVGQKRTLNSPASYAPEQVATITQTSQVPVIQGPPAAPILVSNATGYAYTVPSAYAVNFVKGASPYNVITGFDGSVLVHSDSTFLEASTDGGNTWNRVGASTGAASILGPGYDNITNSYSNGVGTTYGVTYTTYSSNTIETTITIHAGTTEMLRLHWAESGITRTFYLF